MATYVISGVWKDSNGTITHYAFHLDDAQNEKFGSLTKKSKSEAVSLLETNSNSAKVLVWNYNSATWQAGEDVYVAGTGASKHLKSKPDDKTSDNLGHLICWNGFISL